MLTGCLLPLLVGAAGLAGWSGSLANAQPSTVKGDEEIEFFRTVVTPKPGGGWVLRVHGHIYEPEPESRWRGAVAKELAEQIGINAAEADQKLFRERIWPFFADNERNKRIEISVGSKKAVMPESASNGHFKGEIELDKTALQAAASGQQRWARFAAAGAQKEFKGEAVILTEKGLSVISDIDDTIKVSNIGNRQKLIEATFAKPFEAVAGMEKLYRDLATLGDETTPTTFHYLSASPWQLYVPLKSFLDDAGFPRGSFHLRPWRVKDSTLPDLFRSARGHKEQVIRELLNAAPARRFVLVGDSTEGDAEIFSSLAKEFPDRIVLVAIRQTPDFPLSAERAEKAAAPLGPDQWLLFADPAEWFTRMQHLRRAAK